MGDREKFLFRINEMLDRKWLSNNGPLVQEFERIICEILGVKHAIAMCNATVALGIASKALGLEGEVILPSYTFVATAHALQWQGITPVFADIDPATHNVDPSQIERLITPKTSGIVGVHVWGRGCDTNALEAIARRHGLRLMYDASHAFGCSAGCRMIGNFGECEVFSFHATKFINSFEGGAVVTNDDDLANRLRLMRNFGFKGFDNVVYLGVNGKMSEVCAAMGLTNLEAMDDIIAVNRRNYFAYCSEMPSGSGLSVIEYDPVERNNYQYVVVEVNSDVCPRSRDDIVRALHAQNIMARKYFWPACHRMEPYVSMYRDACLGLTNTESVAAKVFVLPTGQSVGENDIRRICAVVRDCLRG